MATRLEMATNNSLFGFGDADIQVVVYGPDGKAYGSPAQARAAGVTNYTMSPPAGGRAALAYTQQYIPGNYTPNLTEGMKYGDPIYSVGDRGNPSVLIGRVGMTPAVSGSSREGNVSVSFNDDPTYQRSQQLSDFQARIASGQIEKGSSYGELVKGQRSFEDASSAYTSYDPTTNMVRFYDPEGSVTQEGQRTSSGGGFFNQIGQGFNQIVSQPDVQKAIMLAALAGTAYAGLGVPGAELGINTLPATGAGVAGAAPALTPAALESLIGSAGYGTNAAAALAAPGLGIPAATVGAGSGLLSSLGNAASNLLPSSSTLSSFGGAASSFLPSLITGGLQGLGAANTAEKAREAAQIQAAAQVEAARIAADAAKFRPVGVTTRFGASNFQTDAQGNVIGAGYTASPEIQAYQNRLSALAAQGLTGAEGAQAAYAPLTAGAQSLFNLGQGYIQQTPEQQAADYIAKQQALLAPGREQELALLQNKLFQQGRGGAAVAQGGNLMATSPELAAYYNALAQSNLQLAAQGQQAGMEQARFGAGLLGTGSDLMGKYYGGQTAAYAPFATAMDTSSGLESLAERPLSLGTSIGAKTTASAAEAGRLLSQGMISSAATQAPANQFSQSGNILGQFGSNPQLLNALNTSFGVTDPNQVAMQALLKKIYST